MSLTQELPGTEDLEHPEIAVRLWPQSIDFKKLGHAGRISILASQGTEIDPHAVLFSLLTVTGGVIGPDIYLPIGETRHFCRLFSVLVGASSRGRKGSSMAPVLSIFGDLIQEFSAIKSNGPLSSGEGLLWRIRDASDEVDKKGEPTDPGVEDKRLLIMDGEFAAALRAMRREGNTLSAILRSAWDDGDISPLTKTQPVKVTGGHVCVVSHITRDELSVCLTETDALNGFANRILWACTRRQGCVAFPARLSLEFRTEIASILKNALEIASRTTEISITPEAKALFEQAYPILTEDRPGLYGAATSRAEAQTMRLAMILSLIDGSQIIHKDDMLRALDCWRYVEESARFIFGDREPNQRANRILDFLRDGPKTTTQIINDLFSKNGSGIAPVLEHLVVVGKITSRKERTGKKPITWWVLPENMVTDLTE